MITIGKFAGSVSAVALAFGASAALAVPSVEVVGTNYVGVIGTITDTDIVLGTQSTSTTGDSSDTEIFTNTTTTIQNQTLTTTGSRVTSFPNVTIGDTTYTGTIAVSGTGSQDQTVTAVRVDTFEPGLPPVLVDTETTVGDAVNVGAATVTDVSVEGSVGNVIESFGGTISTVGGVDAVMGAAATGADGSAVVTANSYIATTSGLPETGGAPGVVYEQRVGSATFNPSTGQVTITLPTEATSRTAVTSAGLTTTGSVTASSVSATTVTATSLSATSISTSGINMNGGKITNLGNGTAATDAINLGQLNSAVGTLNTSIAALNSSLSARIDTVGEAAEAGTAVAIAMGGGFFLPNKKINISVNYGNYEGQSAIAGSLGFLVSENFALNAGVATSFKSVGGTGFRVGGTFGF